MSISYDVEFNKTENEGDNRLILSENPNSKNYVFNGYIYIEDEQFPFSESLNYDEEDDEEGFPFIFNNCNNTINDDHLNDNTSLNKIESNQKLCQKKTSDTSKEKEKEKENIKNDEKPNIEIPNSNNSNSSNNNENGNSYKEEKKSIININNKRNTKKNTKRLRGKYRFENIMKKIKPFLFKSILRYVNSLIKGRKRLKKIVKEVARNTAVEFNKKLLKTKLEDILSMDISTKYIKYNENYNKKIIEKIYEEKNQNQNVTDILKMELKDFINKFKENPTLKRYYDSFINDMKEKQPDDYIRTFENYFDNYTKLCEGRKPKNKSKKEK